MLEEEADSLSRVVVRGNWIGNEGELLPAALPVSQVLESNGWSLLNNRLSSEDCISNTIESLSSRVAPKDVVRKRAEILSSEILKHKEGNGSLFSIVEDPNDCCQGHCLCGIAEGGYLSQESLDAREKMRIVRRIRDDILESFSLVLDPFPIY